MEYAKLGLTELEISRIGFGCWAIGGHGYGKTDDGESIKAIQKALNLGINFFDTADVYGFGHSEEILSKALGRQKDRVIIATKFGVNWDQRGNTFYDCSPKRVSEALEASLRRLKIDCIPLYQIHWYDNVSPILETLEVLKRCQESGKIRYIGCSNFPFQLLTSISEKYRIESVQYLFNLSHRESEREIRECADILGMSIFAYNILARGLFSGKFNQPIVFGEGDTRSKDINFQGELLKKNLRLVNTMKEVGLQHGKTSSQVAIRWVLENKNITCAITGAVTQRQIEENVGAMGWKLSEADLDYLGEKAGFC